MAFTTLEHLSTNTPASNVSSAEFAAQDDRAHSDELTIPNFDDILKNSPAAKLIGLKDVDSDDESLPDEDEGVQTQEDSTDEDPDAVDDSESGEDEGSEDDETKEEESEDDESTQADLPKEEDIDWEYKVPVTINGKVEYKTLAEVRKGFATDQHLSQKGRELGELKKQVDAERETKLQELVTLGTVLHQEISAQEKTLETQYAEITAQIKSARDSGDTYTARDLKDKQEEIQEKYWAMRNKREEGTKQVVAQLQAKQTEEQQNMVAQFQEDIVAVLPGFDDKLAKSIRKFALDEGIPEALLESVYSAKVVKFINDFRVLKTAQTAGATKRKTVVAAKSVPTKKGTPAAVKATTSQQKQREQVLTGQGSERDQLDFLKRLSSVSKKL
jgi:hypothetical protein